MDRPTSSTWTPPPLPALAAFDPALAPGAAALPVPARPAAWEDEEEDDAMLGFDEEDEEAEEADADLDTEDLDDLDEGFYDDDEEEEDDEEDDDLEEFDEEDTDEEYVEDDDV